MPVRSRGSLLAGLGALLGLCIAGAGCQLAPAKQDTIAQQAPKDSTPRPWFCLRHSQKDPHNKESGQDLQTVAEDHPAEDPGPVSMLRPIAIRAASDESGPAAETPIGLWHAANATEGGVAPEQTTAAGATIGAPIPAPPHQPEAQPKLEADGQPPPAVNPVIPIPATGPPLDKKLTPAVFIGPPKPLHPPLAGAHVPKEFEKHSLSSYVIEPPDILLIQGSPAIGLRTQPLQGSHLVRPDGTVSLGIYGEVYLAGMTLEQAKTAVAEALIRYGIKIEKIDEKGNKVDATKAETLIKELQVDVLAYNSKFYYVITDGGGYGQQVFRLPITGNETVLDAISLIGGLPLVACKKSIWLARATPYDCAHPNVLPVDWKSISQYGIAATNYQLYPGDRLFVQSDPLIRTDTILNKILTPLQRVTGAVLLGSTTRNSLHQP